VNGSKRFNLLGAKREKWEIACQIFRRGQVAVLVKVDVQLQVARCMWCETTGLEQRHVGKAQTVQGSLCHWPTRILSRGGMKPELLLFSYLSTSLQAPDDSH